MHVSCTELRNQRQAAGAHYLIEELDQCELSLRHIKAIVTCNRLAGQVCTRVLCQTLCFQLTKRVSCRITLLQTTEDQLKGVPLQRHVVTEAVLGAQRPATRSGGVDADAIEIDVLRVLDEITREAGERQTWIVLLRGARAGRIVHQTTDVRQTAIILDVVEA